MLDAPPVPLPAGADSVPQCEFFDTRCLTMERAQIMTLSVAKQFRPDLPVPDEALQL